ncbi:MAG: hypothetical protein QGF71_01230 [Rhodospirillales bacterium]|nr:hypothetical protein [Rhodospirillales bacterium]
MDYWDVKRNTEVCVIASIRTMKGDLVGREELKFETGKVINYSHFDHEDDFEGSVEIEVFALQDLVFPFVGVAPVSSCGDNQGALEMPVNGRVNPDHQGGVKLAGC